MQHRIFDPYDTTNPFGYVFAVLGLGSRRGERGASAVEWVIIAALVVGIALAVGGILINELRSEAQDIGNKINNA